MITVTELLNAKGREIYAVSPETTVYETLKTMSEKDIGVVLIMVEGKMVGVFSERDYVRNLVNSKNFSETSPVKSFMSTGVITVRPDSDLFVCMILMTNMRIRHLPVVDQHEVIGIVTIGDVVNAIIKTQKRTIEDLEGYISGKYL